MLIMNEKLRIMNLETILSFNNNIPNLQIKNLSNQADLANMLNRSKFEVIL